MATVKQLLKFAPAAAFYLIALAATMRDIPTLSYTLFGIGTLFLLIPAWPYLKLSRIAAGAASITLAINALRIREWKEPFWNEHEFVDPKLIARRYAAITGENETKDEIDKLKSLINTNISETEFNAISIKLSALEEKATSFKSEWNIMSNLIHMDLHTRLREGKVLARGFLTPHAAGRAPVVIPPHEWELLALNRDPDGAIASGAGIEYIAVKIGHRARKP